MDDNNFPWHDKQALSTAVAQTYPPQRQERLRRVLVITSAVCGACMVAAIAYLGWLARTTPDVNTLQQMRTAQPSVLLSADGRPLATMRLAQQETVDLQHVSPWVVKALVATEDHRFFQHRGVDYGRTIAALFHTLTGDAQGGSTITQQLARNVFPEEIGRSRTLNRKLKEIVTAIKIERAYSKEQILETYLNTMPFMYNVFGIEKAARTYFNKSAAELGPLESATLIGMLKGTYAYNPVANPERSRIRRNVVLSQMVKHDLLAESDFQRLREQPLIVQFNRPSDLPELAPHFVEHVRKWLAVWADQNDYDIYRDGLVVHTTLDLSLQEAATRALNRQAEALQSVADVEWGQASLQIVANTPSVYSQLRTRIEPFRHFWKTQPALLTDFVRESAEYKKAREGGESDAQALARLKADASFMKHLRADKTRLEAGFVAMDPSTGEVKAWVGSRDFRRDRFDHVAQAARQPGSTFKPIVYAAALERGFGPARVYYDNPVNIVLTDGKLWSPSDMSSASGRPMTLTDGLVYSKNTITTQVMQEVGVPGIVSLAQAVGVNRSKLDPVPSLALGTSPVTLLEMVSAYATIARMGQYHQPTFIRRVTDRNGKVLAEFGAAGRRAISEDTAIELIDMMRGVVTRGTGTAVKTRFGISNVDIAGKTGTTQNNTDGWFILMHPRLVAGAWVGFNDSRVTMRSDYWGQGGHNAILLVGDFFRDAMNARLIDVKAQFPRPSHPPMTIVESPQDWNNQFSGRGEPSDQPSQPEAVRIFGPTVGAATPDPRWVEPFERHEPERPVRNAEEVARIMSGMGRDPVTGAALGIGNGHSADSAPPVPRSPPPPPPPHYERLAQPEVHTEVILESGR